MSGAWEIMKRPAILCAILHTDVTTLRWAFALKNLIFPGPHHISALAGMPFDHARNVACQQVMANPDIEYLFFLDSDVCPPADALLRLCAHRVPVVSGMYCRRSPPHGVPVAQKNGTWLTDLPGPGQNPVVEVDVCGAGCLLIHRSVLELPPQRQGKPWFDWRVDLRGIMPDNECMSEDFTWNYHIRKFGIKTLLDTSVRCLHVGFSQAEYGSLIPLVT